MSGEEGAAVATTGGGERDRGWGLALRVFLPFAFGYFLSYLFRVVNAVLAPDLVRDLDLDARDLGFLTGVYFLTFASFQLPLGLLLDRFGSRRTEAALLLFAALGAVLFAMADDFATLVIGRALIGLGVSACLMAAFRAFVVWFPLERLPLINGAQMAAGGLGAVAAAAPVELALTLTDWRGVFVLVAGLTLLCALLVFLVVPEEPRAPGKTTLGALLAGSRAILASPLFWRVAPMTIASQASFLAIQGLWAGPWLRDVGGLERGEVAARLSLVAVAMVAGFVGLGWITVRLSRRGVPPLTVAIGAMLLFMLAQVPLVLGTTVAMSGAWLAFGVFGTAGILPYAALSQRFPKHLAGRLNTSLNMLVFFVAFLAQWGIGAIIRAFPAPAPDRFSPTGFSVAFGVMLGLQIAAVAWFHLFRRGSILGSGARAP